MMKSRNIRFFFCDWDSSVLNACLFVNLSDSTSSQLANFRVIQIRVKYFSNPNIETLFLLKLPVFVYTV